MRMKLIRPRLSLFQLHNSLTLTPFNAERGVIAVLERRAILSFQGED